LIELLVVIAIIAVLASVAFTLGPRMLKKAKGTEAMSNLRQISPILSTYASEHNNKLPAIRGIATLPDGTTSEQYWHEACIALMFPDTELSQFKSMNWWKTNKTIFRNPLLKDNAMPRGFSPTTPGFAMNEMVSENLTRLTGGTPSHDENLINTVALASVPDPARTPIVAPSDNYFYRYDDAELGGFQKGTLKDLLIEEKVTVLFLDGHVESISPKDYSARKLSKMPLEN
jgi:prepilin-type processing-associated H-X9-DG protein